MDVNGVICVALMRIVERDARRAPAFGALSIAPKSKFPARRRPMCDVQCRGCTRWLHRVVAARLGLEEDGQDLGCLLVARRCGPACHAADPQTEQTAPNG